ncbi:hypothetical protein DICPUDRAFT_82463 [Dictyostelium purpureum]|uniref:NFACT RNA-binding domain-containing protein n=1 Tax=Dictyostelium purpureum TaxID=5786 RepID=F0ZWL0_DICPU|nr:uncharacterized protein DICPUDRAFT_82463 [Dictyostelium purpureum]EGC31675.1 hypothetical protein DICPUDRAFT_82463 [Dictyostelium purpureum]|eukprot:XP_003291806.1 hypothetical protein DICPUDRAFT_82463 [Dictyostelium purpureum]
MVLFYKIIDPEYIVYMGIDKYENEDLIKYGWPEDIWFHVHDLSSAHVYLRLKKGQTINDIPANVLEECCQLVKNNSIQGCKEPAVDIVYTPWANLKKTPGMEAGAVLYHNDNEAKYVRNVRKSAIIKRADKKAQEDKKKQEEIRNYTSVMKSDNMKSNKYSAIDDDDFM